VIDPLLQLGDPTAGWTVAHREVTPRRLVPMMELAFEIADCLRRRIRFGATPYHQMKLLGQGGWVLLLNQEHPHLWRSPPPYLIKARYLLLEEEVV
jgi:hypothetical protein